MNNFIKRWSFLLLYDTITLGADKMKKEKIKSSSDNLELEIAHIEPNSEIKGVVQISHGMAEHKERYYDFM